MHPPPVLRVLNAALVAVCSLPLHTSGVAPARTRQTQVAPAAPSGDAYGRAIAAREYEATDTAAGLQAPNRAHELRTFFDGAGGRVVDRSDAAHELARVRTVAIGRGADIAPLAPGEVSHDGARVEIRRPGVVKWYENSERALEQGWTLAELPAGDGELAIDVDFGAPASVVGDAATISANGRSLEYGGLAAFDATGRTLSARMATTSDAGRVRIVVVDTDATYPITVDPGLTTPAYATLSSGQSDSAFGLNVAGAGDVNGDGYDDVIVGAFFYTFAQTKEGAAFVFLGGPNGIASGGPSTAAATIRSDQAGGYLDLSVAGVGDTNGDGYADVVAGESGYDAGQTDEGAAFVFLGGPAGPSGSPAAVVQSNQVGAFPGISVSGRDVDGDGYSDVVVGAFPYDGVDDRSGAVFVFRGGPGRGVANGSPRTAAVTVRSRTGGTFASAVAGVGDVNRDGLDDFAVGASGAAGALGDDGAAYVYSRPPAVRAKDTPGVFDAATAGVFLRNTNTSGRADVTFAFGAANAGLTALAGDWDANGIDTPGLYDPATGAFFLSNDNVSGPSDRVFQFGIGGAVPIAGDWHGDGVDTVGLYVPATGTFFLKNTNGAGPADATFTFGAGGSGYVPISGDWNGDGTDTVGLYQPATGAFFLRNENASGPADVAFVFGPAAAGWRPLAGDVDGDGTDTVALYAPASAAFFLRNTNAPGPADLTFTFGAAGLTPLVGDWNGK